MPNIFSVLCGNRSCCALFTTVLMCLDEVVTRELEALNLLHYSPVDVNIFL